MHLEYWLNEPACFVTKVNLGGGEKNMEGDKLCYPLLPFLPCQGVKNYFPGITCQRKMLLPKKNQRERDGGGWKNAWMGAGHGLASLKYRAKSKVKK